MPRCSGCGEEVPEDDKYCPSCGTKVGDDSSRRKRNKEIVYAIAGVLVVIVLATAMVWPAFTFTGWTTSTVANLSTASSTLKTCTGLTPSESAANEKVLKTGTTAANYDLQSLMVLNQNSTSLTFKVQAVAQNDSFGYGPGLLVNGLSDKGFWYQVGLSYKSAHSPGFDMVYEVWNTTSGKSVYPTFGGGGGAVPFWTASPGHDVILSLSITSNEVVMKALDVNTNEDILKNYSSLGATTFVGSDQHSGYPTSLMNEWYHVLPYLCVNQQATFDFMGTPITSGFLAIDEWNFTGRQPTNISNTGSTKTLFATPAEPFNLASNQSAFSVTFHGVGAYVTTGSFVTM